MKKLLLVLSIFILTSCTKDNDLICGYVIDKGQDYDEYWAEWENYIVIETESGRLYDFTVNQRTYRTAIIGDFNCYE